MKQIVSMIGILAILQIFNACNKDLDFVPENPITEQKSNLQFKRSCAMSDHTEKLLQDQNYRKIHQEKFVKIENMVSVRSDCSSSVRLPVAVHYQGVSNPDKACLIQLAEAQIKVLNEDFQGKNSDLSKWTNISSTYFPGVTSGNGCMEFCLASLNHPSGFGLSNGDPAITINATSGDSDARWAGYINIFVQLNTDALGYAPLGGLGDGDGIVVDASAFGTGNGCGPIRPDAPFNLGRTLTHEMGHYLLLDHIWGEGCGYDDGISDTPESKEEYYDCPQPGLRSCNSTDMHMNYMDYTNDACMYVFTVGQSTRMESYLNSSLQHVINKGALVCGTGDGGDAATCEDGIQNGNETGVDCGGADCPPCQNTVCDIPGNIKTTVASTDVQVSFSAVGSANSYQLRYRPQGASIYQQISSTSESISINKLKPSTIYEYSVRSICSGGNSSYSTTAVFSTKNAGDQDGGKCQDFEIDLSITLDDWGSETSYELIDHRGNIIKEGGPFSDEAAGKIVKDNICLEDGCYYLAVYDDYGDGICCEYGNGNIKVKGKNGQILAKSDGYFGYEEYIDFCIKDGRFELVKFRRPNKSNRVSSKNK